MRFGSVCSGIEAASVAWQPFGWEAAFFSEIEPFPSAVLHHHYGAGRPHHMPAPEAVGLDSATRKARLAAIKAVKHLPLITPGAGPINLGDMTAFQEWPDYAIDLLVGGTPCQSFSVAGLRAGLADPRGNLLLTYLAIAARYRPRWLVWENVPGVLSVDEGRAFGSLLGGMAELGYGWAYRVVDAQHTRSIRLPYAVPQRRRRVFVVGYLGDWRRAAAVLFDGASLRGDPPPRRQAGQGLAPALSARTKGGGGLGTDFDLDGGLVPAISPAMKARDAKGASSDGDGDGLPLLPVVAPTLRAGGNRTGGDRPPGTDVDTVKTLVPIAFHGSQDPDVSGDVTHPLGQNYGQEASVAIPFDTTQITSPDNRSSARPGDPAPPVTAEGKPVAVAYGIRSDAQREGDAKTLSADAEGKMRLRPPGMGISEEVLPTIDASTPHSVAYGARQRWAVRRITPIEGERLQGYDDGYTGIMVKGKPVADGPRYKALGNSMATNVMEVIGERIAMVDAQ